MANQKRNKFGVRVKWLDGRETEYWFGTPKQHEFMVRAFNRMKRDGWDEEDSKARVAEVTTMGLPIVARPGANV